VNAADWVRQNDEVYYVNGPIVTADVATIERLKALAAANPRRRARLCGHPAPGDSLHEMLIAHTRETYVRPHRHLHKSESYHVIEGEFDLVLFDDEGTVEQVVAMGDRASGRQFYCRLQRSVYHSLIFLTESVLFQETTNGPFDPSRTVFAPWAPADDTPDAREYFLTLQRLSAEWRASQRAS
jgi:cupin fold WbuC family metalloprotein